MIYCTVCVYRTNKEFAEALSDVLEYRWVTFKSNNVPKYDITIHRVNETHPYYSQHNRSNT